MNNGERYFIKKRIELLKKDIIDTAKKCGRNPEEIKLMAVTKGVDAELIVDAFKEGIDLFGENYIQEASKKLDYIFNNTSLGKRNFHFIGHLQKNKVNKVINYFASIDSIDSIDLCELISEKTSMLGFNVDVMIEVKTSGEESKYGLPPEKAIETVKFLKGLHSINLIGLMTMAPINAPEGLTRKCFRTLYNVWEEIKNLYNLKLPFISMGMSDDYKIAIEEGATMLRIGRAIFGRS